ncbi:hypothetical protein BGLT_02286 [Caballeronia glathei]|nr:hypothetical protein BGLT_02286 [Caballeronia glathei]
MTAYWNGSQIVFAFLCEHGTGRIDEEFDLDDYVWEEWEPVFAAWLVSPRFSPRTELLQWARKGDN